jgi:hypothetical protein
MVVARMSLELKRNVLVAVRRQIQRLLMTLGHVRARSKMEPRLTKLALRLALEQGQSRFELDLLAESWRGKGCLCLYRLGMMGSRCQVLRWGTVGNLHIHLPSAREEIQESRWARLRELEERQTADSRVLPKDQMMGLLLRLRMQRQQSCRGLVVDCHSLVRSKYRPQNQQVLIPTERAQRERAQREQAPMRWVQMVGHRNSVQHWKPGLRRSF